MNAQLLEYARLELVKALAGSTVGMKGQLEVFKLKAETKKNRCRKVHKVQLDDRTVNTYSTPVRITESRNHLSPSPLIKEVEYSTAVWRRSLLKLHKPQIAWLRYCYGFDINFEHQKIICQYAWRLYQPCLGELQQRVIKRLSALVWLAAQEVAAQLTSPENRGYKGSELAAMNSVTRSTWSGIYAPHWKNLKSLFEELDNTALQAILNCCLDHTLEYS